MQAPYIHSLLLASLCGLVADTADTHTSPLQRPTLFMPSCYRRDACSGMPGSFSAHWADYEHIEDKASSGVEGRHRSKVDKASSGIEGKHRSKVSGLESGHVPWDVACPGSTIHYSEHPTPSACEPPRFPSCAETFFPR